MSQERIQIGDHVYYSQNWSTRKLLTPAIVRAAPSGLTNDEYYTLHLLQGEHAGRKLQTVRRNIRTEAEWRKRNL